MPEEQLENKRHYKVEVGDIVTVERNDVREYTFYKIPLLKINMDGTKSYYKKNIAFKKGVELENGTKIRVLDFFEDVFIRQNDKYNANWTLMITEFEIIENDNSDAINQFNEMMDESKISEADIAF